MNVTEKDLFDSMIEYQQFESVYCKVDYSASIEKYHETQNIDDIRQAIIDFVQESKELVGNIYDYYTDEFINILEFACKFINDDKLLKSLKEVDY